MEKVRFKSKNFSKEFFLIPIILIIFYLLIQKFTLILSNEILNFTFLGGIIGSLVGALYVWIFYRNMSISILDDNLIITYNKKKKLIIGKHEISGFRLTILKGKNLLEIYRYREASISAISYTSILNLDGFEKIMYQFIQNEQAEFPTKYKSIFQLDMEKFIQFIFRFKIFKKTTSRINNYLKLSIFILVVSYFSSDYFFNSLNGVYKNMPNDDFSFILMPDGNFTITFQGNITRKGNWNLEGDKLYIGDMTFQYKGNRFCEFNIVKSAEVCYYKDESQQKLGAFLGVVCGFAFTATFILIIFALVWRVQ